MPARRSSLVGTAFALALVAGAGIALRALSNDPAGRPPALLAPIAAIPASAPSAPSESSAALAPSPPLARPLPPTSESAALSVETPVAAIAPLPEPGGRAPAALEVRVVASESGAGLPGCEVRLEREELVLAAGVTDAEGLVRLSLPLGIGRGELRVRLASLPAGRLAPLPLRAVAEAEGGRLVLRACPWPPQPAGAVRGRLRSESGRFDDLDALLAGGVVLDLVSLPHADPELALAADPPRVLARAELAAHEEPGGEVVIEYSFEEVPAGGYELSLSSLGPHVWSPPARLVSPPADGVDFLRLDAGERVRIAFRVRDAQTGESIADWQAWSLRASVSPDAGVLLHAGPLAAGAITLHGRLEWSLVAPGYAPAFGDERAFRPDAESDGTGQRLVADVALRRGWSTRFVVMARDPHARPAPGARVELDGRPAGRTDANGVLDVWRAERPARVSVEWSGWTLASEDLLDAGDALARRRGQITPLLLRAP